MKGKILVALKTKYKTFGFGDKAFDGVADYLSKTVTEESQIETAISGVEGLLKAFQGDIDTVRNEKSGLQKQLDELKNKIENPNPNPNSNPKPEDKKDDMVNRPVRGKVSGFCNVNKHHLCEFLTVVVAGIGLFLLFTVLFKVKESHEPVLV